MSTACEILDSLEPEDSFDTLVMDCMAFTICPECGHVDEEEETLIDHPCQTCARNVEVRQILFDDEERLVEMIFECYRSEKSKEACIILYCSLIENHVRNLLKGRCSRLNIQWLVTNLLLEKCERVDERLKLFERLTGIGVKEALAGHSGAEIFDAYSVLRYKRNRLAHGNPAAPHEITQSDIKAAVNGAADSFSCFAFLHHKFCSIDGPPLPKS